MEEERIVEIETGGILVPVLLGLILAISLVVVKPAMPLAVILQIPFTSQAPNGNWDRNEDCEETSITMARAFLDGQVRADMTVTDAQRAINQLKSWENINIGYNKNTGAEATTKMAEGAFGLRVTQIIDYTENDLKNALAEGHPILLPINAKLLNNPKYLNGGPLYHMVVLRGYHKGKFIVNDPGTVTGKANEYTFEVLKNAAADWNQATKSLVPNSKIALVLSK